MYHPDDDFPRYIRKLIEVEIQPLRAAYQEFVAVGDSHQAPPAKVKQFIRSVDGIYFGGAERWVGEWAKAAEVPKE